MHLPRFSRSYPKSSFKSIEQQSFYFLFRNILSPKKKNNNKKIIKKEFPKNKNWGILIIPNSMKVLIGEHHPSRGRHLKYRGNEKPGLFLDLIKSLMTARSKASRNFATRRVGMERVEDRFPYARGCMIDSWIIPNTRIQNSGLMYMVN